MPDISEKNFEATIESLLLVAPMTQSQIAACVNDAWSQVLMSLAGITSVRQKFTINLFA